MKTTKKHFKLFKKECRYWIDKFGLKDFDISFKHTKCNDLGRCVWSSAERWAIIVLSKKFANTKPTDSEIRETAFHEVCELLLADLYTLAEERYIDRNQLKMTRHAVIQRLMNSYFREKR